MKRTYVFVDGEFVERRKDEKGQYHYIQPDIQRRVREQCSGAKLAPVARSARSAALIAWLARSASICPRWWRRGWTW